MLVGLIFNGISLMVRAKKSRYAMAIRPPVMMLMAVAIAAPLTPIPRGKMNSQSNTTFIMAGIMLHHIAYFGAPSSLIMNMPISDHISNRNAGMIHFR